MIRLALYGDSLALPRKKIVDNEERYFSLLQSWLLKNTGAPRIQTLDRSKGGVTITELFEWVNHDLGYFDFPGEIAILHCGIVDCAPRPVDLKQRAFISKLPGFIKYRIIKYLHNNRSRILSKGRSYVITKQEEFEKIFLQLIEVLSKNYQRVYILNICPTNEQTEKHSPGFTKNIDLYNTIIKRAILSKDYSNLTLVDINSYINERSDKIDSYIVKEDGHHITPLTHVWIADEIVRQEQSILNNKNQSLYEH